MRGVGECCGASARMSEGEMNAQRTGGRWGHGEDGGRKAARGQVTEAASVEEAEAWCVAAGDDVGEPS